MPDAGKGPPGGGGGGGSSSTAVTDKICHYCKKPGHLKAQCKKKARDEKKQNKKQIETRVY